MTNQQIKPFTLEWWQEQKEEAYLTALEHQLYGHKDSAIRFYDIYKWIKQRIKNR